MKAKDLEAFQNRKVVYYFNNTALHGIVEDNTLYTKKRKEVFLGKVEKVELHPFDKELYFVDEIKQEFFNQMRNEEHLHFKERGLKNLGEYIETYRSECNCLNVEDGVMYIPFREELLTLTNQDSLSSHLEELLTELGHLRQVFYDAQDNWGWNCYEYSYYRYQLNDYLRCYYKVYYGAENADLPF